MFSKKIQLLKTFFPQIEDSRNKKYWDWKLPISKFLITGKKQKKQILNELFKGLLFLQNNKKENIFLKIIVIFYLNDTFSSEITVFFDEEYYNNFFIRNDENQKWIILPKSRSLLKEWRINCNLNEIGFLEEINDEDYSSKDELWMYGDVEI